MGRARRTQKSPRHPSMSRTWPTHPPAGAPQRRLPSLFTSTGDVDVPECPTCGRVENLRSALQWDDETLDHQPVTMFCTRCGTPVAVLG